MPPGGECQLADGREVALRRAGPGDVPAITRHYLELSPESFYRRFNTEQPAPAQVAQLASLGNGTACLVATPSGNPGRLVAEARYVPTAPGTAELALTIHDGYQRAGMGTCCWTHWWTELARTGWHAYVSSSSSPTPRCCAF